VKNIRRLLPKSKDQIRMLSDSEEPEFTEDELKDAIQDPRSNMHIRNRIPRRTADSRNPFAHQAPANCLCTAFQNAYADKGCAKKLKNFKYSSKIPLWKQVNPMVVECTLLWQNINNGEDSSLCPADASFGSCGLAVNLDLYGRGLMNGIEISQKRFGTQSSRSIQFDVKSDEEGAEEFKSWLEGERKRITFKQGKVVWRGLIPKRIGAFLRKSCESFKWRAGTRGARVDFTGLTFRDANDGQSIGRRRRLQATRSEC
jgi:hypothetical protein